MTSVSVRTGTVRVCQSDVSRSGQGGTGPRVFWSIDPLRLQRLHRVGHVVLPQLARAPTRDVEEAVIKRQVNIALTLRYNAARNACAMLEIL